MISSGHAHSFLGIDHEGRVAVIRADGNPDRHLVLRGGSGGPNYGPEDVQRATEFVADQGIQRPVMIDCSHGNSGGDYRRQVDVCRTVLEQVREGQSFIMGVALESNLLPGRQTWVLGRELRRGVSITDACLGWDETESLLLEVAAAVAAAGRLGAGPRSEREPIGVAGD